MKKKIKIAILLALIFNLSIISHAEEYVEQATSDIIDMEVVMELTLEEAIKIGFENNMDVIIKKLELEKSNILYEKEIRNVRDMERNIDLIFSRDPITGYRLEDAAINRILVKNGTMRRTVELNHNIAIWNVLIAENNLTYRIKQSYYDTTLASEQLGIARENLELSNKQLAYGKLRLSVGMISKQQLLALELALAQSQSQLDGANLAYELQLINFRNLIGIPLYSVVKLTEPISTSTYEPIDISRSITEALENNSMLKITKERYKLSELNFEAVKIKYPDITYRYQEEALVVANAKRSVEQVRASVEIGVRSAYLSLMTSEKQIATFELAVKQAEEALRITELSFQLGQNTANDVTQANINLMNAKKSLAQQIHAFNLALLDFEYSTGIGK